MGNEKQKPRVIVMTDISSLKGGILEPDDTQSMIRLLLYANEFDIEGLIATAYGEYGIHPDYIETLIRGYGQVHPKLVCHDPAYPRHEELLSLIKSGSPRCGMTELGEGKDTEASEWIIRMADRKDGRPLWILLWGGALDLAQAVWKVKSARTNKEAMDFLGKLRIYSIGDQYDESGRWLKETCPELFYITNYRAFRGIYRGGCEELVSPAWVERNIYGHGELAELYPMYCGGDPWGCVRGIKEGDTPSFLYLIPNGMHDPEKPWEESWGGQFYPVTKKDNCRHFEDANDPPKAAQSVWKWREAFQGDFARRLGWCL